MLAAGVPATGDELWRGSAGQACDLLLVNEIGGVRVGANSSPDSVPVVIGNPELTIDAAIAGGRTTLAVKRSGATASSATASSATASSATASTAVELSVSPECRVAVRTTDGPVTVEIGPDAFPLAVDTVTGDVTAWVDPAAGATILLATSDEITTDYTIALDFRYHQEPAKHGRIVTGREAQGDGAMGEATGTSIEVHLRSRRGAVSVLRPAAELVRP